MKLFTKLFIIVILFVLIIVSGCTQQLDEGTASESIDKVEEELSDEQLLAQNPDYLDEALQELDEIE